MTVNHAEPTPRRTLSDSALTGSAEPVVAAAEARTPTVDSVVSLMPGFVYVFNHATYSNDYTNRSVGEQLGYSSQEIVEFGADMMTHIVHPEDLPRLSGHLTRIARLKGDASVSLEYRVIRKDGGLRWLRSVDAVFDRAPDGSVLSHIGCASDVTSEKEAELRLAHLNSELEAKVSERTHDLAQLNEALESRITERTYELQDAVEELEQLTYIATHDLKVPVNNLCRLGIMLNDSVHLLTPDQAEQVGWINDCAAQLSAKIQGLVLVAQIRLSSVLPAEALNLRSAVLDVVDKFHQTMGPGARPVAVEVPQDVFVDFARFELSSMLSAMLDNAIKYADAKRPLEVTFRATVENGQVSLLVIDNGTGLDGQRDKEKVFGLFQRAHKEPAGSGISLYCARRMLLRRGGDITVEGMRGQHAAFNVRFPKFGETSNDQ